MQARGDGRSRQRNWGKSPRKDKCNVVGQLLGKEIYGQSGGHNFSKEILNEHTHTRALGFRPWWQMDGDNGFSEVSRDSNIRSEWLIGGVLDGLKESFHWIIEIQYILVFLRLLQISDKRYAFIYHYQTKITPSCHEWISEWVGIFLGKNILYFPGFARFQLPGKHEEGRMEGHSMLRAWLRSMQNRFPIHFDNACNEHKVQLQDYSFVIEACLKD